MVQTSAFSDLIILYVFLLQQLNCQGCHKKWKTKFPDFSLTIQQNSVTILVLPLDELLRNGMGYRRIQRNVSL